MKSLFSFLQVLWYGARFAMSQPEGEPLDKATVKRRDRIAIVCAVVVGVIIWFVAKGFVTL